MYLMYLSLQTNRLTEDGTELFGKGSKRGLLSWLPPRSALLLNNVHKAPESVLPLLEKELITASVAASLDEDEQIFIDDQGHSTTASSCLPRILMTAETCVSLLDKYATVIRVPPLRVRPEDIDDLTRYFIRSLGRQRGIGRSLELTPEALKRLEAGQYPNNVSELEAAVQRALAQVTRPSQSSSLTEDVKPVTIGEEVFWFASQEKDLLRVNLLKTVPMLRKFLRSDTWPERINFGFTVYAFAGIVAILFLGPQDREHNFALNAFWCYWWPLSFIAYPFLGRIWCSICPFMIYGELVQRWQLANGAILRKWPRAAMDRWGSWFLFALFGAILVWEEVWDLPHTAALSSWLLLLITAGAMIGSFFFERRIWCRYLCPIGGMNGLFAKLSITELRARQGVCSAECSTYSCFKGGPATPPEGLETSGCPVYSHPAQLTDNRNCVLCMDCLKACPHRSIEFRLRVPAADLWGGSHIPIPAESALMFMLLGAVYLHDLPTLIQDTGMESFVPELTINSTHIALSLGVLALPGVLAYGVDAAWRGAASGLLHWYKPELESRRVSARRAHANSAVAILDRAAASYAEQQSGLPLVAPAKSFLELSYGYLPLVWGGTLAYYLRSLLTEAGRIIPVAAETFGVRGLHLNGLTIVAPSDVVLFLQGTTLLGSTVLSLGMLRRIAGQPWRVVLHHCFLCCVFGAELWHTIMSK